MEADQKCGGKHTVASHICIVKTNSYGQLIKSVGGICPHCPLIPAPMATMFRPSIQIGMAFNIRKMVTLIYI